MFSWVDSPFGPRLRAISSRRSCRLIDLSCSFPEVIGIVWADLPAMIKGRRRLRPMAATLRLPVLDLLAIEQFAQGIEHVRTGQGARPISAARMFQLQIPARHLTGHPG